jgi:hypothetical protein
MLQRTDCRRGHQHVAQVVQAYAQDIADVFPAAGLHGHPALSLIFTPGGQA